MNEKGGVWIIGLILVGLFIGLPVLGTAFKLFTLPWLQFTTKIDQNQQIIKKTYDADNQIYNYEWFKQKEQDITAAKNQRDIANQSLKDFETAAGSRDKWGFEDKTVDARLRAVYQGLQNHVEQLVADYNARANMANRSIFENGLKTFIPLD